MAWVRSAYPCLPLTGFKQPGTTTILDAPRVFYYTLLAPQCHIVARQHASRANLREAAGGVEELPRLSEHLLNLRGRQLDLHAIVGRDAFVERRQ